MSRLRAQCSVVLILIAACAEEAVLVPGDLALEAVTPVSGTPGWLLDEPLRVRVLGSDGQPEVGVMVEWSTTSADGWLSSESSVTNADGYAEIEFVPGYENGSQVVRAKVQLSTVDLSVRITTFAVKSVASTSTHGCGLDADGRLWCWKMPPSQDGTMLSGFLTVLGARKISDEVVPVRADDRMYSELVGSGNDPLVSAVFCALTTTGELRCWSDIGSDGRVNSSSIALPAPMANLVIASSHSDFTICGLDSTGQAWCRGANPGGQLGDGAVGSRDDFLPVAGAAKFGVLTAGDRMFCGLEPEGRGWCWGHADPADFLTPTEVPGGPYSRLVPMMGGACGLDLTTRTTSCWGSTFMNPDNEGISVLVDGGESAIDLIGASMIGMIHADGGRIRVIGEFLYGHVWNLSTRKFSEYPIRPLVNRMITDDASYWCAELQGGATVCTPDMGLPLGIPVPY